MRGDGRAVEAQEPERSETRVASLRWAGPFGSAQGRLAEATASTCAT